MGSGLGRPLDKSHAWDFNKIKTGVCHPHEPAAPCPQSHLEANVPHPICALGLSVEERFWAYVDTTSDCWEWVGAKQPSGYGSFTVRYPTMEPSHRFAYQAHRGEVIPHGLEIDHLCRNRSCVNPAHLELVTRRENVRRSAAPNPDAGEEPMGRRIQVRIKKQ